MRVLRSVDTIADFIDQRTRETPGVSASDTRNVFTVDLEEWFHICGVGGALCARALGRAAVARRADHAAAARSARSRRRPRDVLRRRLGRRAASAACREMSGRPATTSGRTAISIERAYELGPSAFVADLRASVAALRAAGGAPCRLFRAPEWSINDRSLWALEALAREGFTIDASMAPVQDRRVASTIRGIRTCGRPRAGPIIEVPPLVADRFGQVMPLGWGWGLRMSSPRRVLRTIEAVESAGRPAVLDRASVGARSRSAARAASGSVCGSRTTSG